MNNIAWDNNYSNTKLVTKKCKKINLLKIK